MKADNLSLPFKPSGVQNGSNALKLCATEDEASLFWAKYSRAKIVFFRKFKIEQQLTKQAHVCGDAREAATRG
jgi:hypothetical protein